VSVGSIEAICVNFFRFLFFLFFLFVYLGLKIQCVLSEPVIVLTGRKIMFTVHLDH
jgi:hypothetical protein